MSKYNFENDENEFGQTRRLDSINTELKKYKRENELEEKEGYLRHFNTEQFHEEKIKETKEIPAQNRPAQNRPTQNRPPHATRQTEPKIPRQRGGKTPPSYTAAILILFSALIFAGVFFMVFRIMGGGKKIETTPPVVTQQDPVTNKENNETQNETQTKEPEGEEDIVLIQEVSPAKELILYNITNNKNDTIKTSKQTEVFDEKSVPMSLSALAPGDIVKIVLDDTNNTAVKVSYTKEVFEKEDATGAKVDTAKKTITLSGQAYTYTEDTVFKYKNNTISPSKLDEIDVLFYRGTDDKIWFVDVMEYHGYITIKNKDKIKDGTIEINHEKPVSLSQAGRITVAEGAHSIVIKGSNIETYTADIFIVANEEFSIDLSDAQTKTGVIILNVNIEDYKLTVNGSETSYGAPLVLPQGEYTLRITKEGYSTWEQKVTLSEPSVEITAVLEELVKNGRLVISSSPSAAYVYVDNDYIGVSPISVTLEYGEHRILLKMDGYEDVSSPVIINKQEETIMVDMKEKLDFSGQQ